MILIIDNYDSFTYNLVDYFNQLGLDVEVRRNNTPLSELISKEFNALVLSPGPGIPKNAGNLLKILDHYHTYVPILGICLGHQAIAEYFHGEIVQANKPMHGKLSKIVHNGDLVFNDMPKQFNVVRYHSLICNNLPDSINVIARTNKQEIMAIKHKYLPIYGLQFHPEAVLTEYGLRILENWKNINSLTH